MIGINLDFSGVRDEFKLSNEEFDLITKQALNETTQAIYDAWVAAANNELNSTKKDYINSLRIIEEGRFTNNIILFGYLNNMIEFGMPAYDMKIGFQNSSKIKYSKKGNWFLSIPFRWGTPDSDLPKTMPQEIYDVVKKEGEINKENIPAAFQTRAIRERVNLLNRQVDEYKHKTSIYMGIKKQSQTYEKTSQSLYVSFRRVGENSDPNSWIHKGIQAYNLADKALSSIDTQEISENSVNNSLIKLGF